MRGYSFQGESSEILPNTPSCESPAALNVTLPQIQPHVEIVSMLHIPSLCFLCGMKCFFQVGIIKRMLWCNTADADLGAVNSSTD